MESNNPALQQQLASVVGTEYLQQHKDALVVAPADTTQVAEVLKLANTARASVRPTGGGTKLAWGNPVQAEIYLSLHRLNAVRDHVWQDMTVTVEAGCPWGAMQNHLQQHGQHVALDPLWPAEASIGGIVATNESGALRLRYGSLRDLVIGMTIVLPDGTIARSGGKVVKNVAGYDLHKLMTGAQGTLGIITEVNFRLHPREQHVQSWTITCNNAMELDVVMHKVLDSQMVVSSMQMRGHAQGHALDVCFASLPECLADHHHQLQRMSTGLQLTIAEGLVWQARERLFSPQAAIVLKASLLSTQIAGFSARLQQLAAQAALTVNSTAQATGLLTASIHGDPQAAASVVQSLRAELNTSDGSLVVLQMAGELRGKLSAWGDPGDALPLMRRIKQRFDPNGILNPGHFVGGI